MFSVIRFSKFADTERLHAAGAEINRLAPGSFTGPDRVADRFSCVVSEDDDWENHCRAIERMITTLAPVIRNLVSAGIEMELDVAIDPDDYHGRLLTLFPLRRNLMKAIVDFEISLMLSLYGIEV